jgi:ABC-type metal ion transport system, periplasmic component/surface adhesin
MKRILAIILAAAMATTLMTGCSSNPKQEASAEKSSKSKIQIVATLFPQYDFARQIAGDKADVTLLLPPGVESHSYEPTPSDIIKINQSDLFIYTGKYMEAWSQKIIDSMKDSGSKSFVLDVSKGVSLEKTEDEVRQHQKGSEENEGNQKESEGHEDQLYDPHIWTDPMNAKIMAENIADALCSIDPANADYYKENAKTYGIELDELDSQFRTIVQEGKRNELIFGSRFALYYFVKRYGLEYQAAFDSCSSETEPSVKTVAALIKKMKEDKIPVIYYAEMEDPKVARSISSETGSKMLLFHSCHNVTKKELESGATYLSLMKQNAANLKEGLE